MHASTIHSYSSNACFHVLGHWRYLIFHWENRSCEKENPMIRDLILYKIFKANFSSAFFSPQFFLKSFFMFILVIPVPFFFFPVFLKKFFMLKSVIYFRIVCLKRYCVPILVLVVYPFSIMLLPQYHQFILS